MNRKELEKRISVLEEENKSLYKALREAVETINCLQAAADDSFQQSPEYKQMQNENKLLKIKINSLENRLKKALEKSERQIELIENLQNASPIRNERGGGRKKADQKWKEGFEKFKKCIESQKSIIETMDELGISRSTYYRYKKVYNQSSR